MNLQGYLVETLGLCLELRRLLYNVSYASPFPRSPRDDRRLLSQLATCRMVNWSFNASVMRPTRRFARSGAVFTVTSLKGPFGGMSAMLWCFGGSRFGNLGVALIYSDC